MVGGEAKRPDKPGRPSTMMALRSVELVRKPRIVMSKAVAPERCTPVMYLYRSATSVVSIEFMNAWV